MDSIREARLEGIGRAASLHEELHLENQLASGAEPIDVFEFISALEVPLYFRPLDGLLGLYLPPPAGPGILVTAQRSLHIQRFTAAHELGHHLLEHNTPSFDKEIGVPRKKSQENYLQEAAADAFASELLLPRWLIAAHARKREWIRSDLTSPDIVYQLSLRLAMSYESTSRSLYGHEMITRPELDLLLETTPKTCKERIADSLVPKSWFANIWDISIQDAGSLLLGSPDDILILELTEHTSAGYVWDTKVLSNLGLSILEDARKETSELIGATSIRRIAFQGATKTEFEIAEKRTWSDSPPIGSLHLSLALEGRRSLPLGS